MASKNSLNKKTNFLSDLNRQILDRIDFDPIRSSFLNLRSDQVRSDQVFKICDPIKFDPIRFSKFAMRSSSIRSGFQNLRSDQVRSDQALQNVMPTLVIRPVFSSLQQPGYYSDKNQLSFISHFPKVKEVVSAPLLNATIPKKDPVNYILLKKENDLTEDEYRKMTKHSLSR